MNMKHSFLTMALLLTAFTAKAQVTVPFDVPAPAWEMLVTAADERDEPLVYRDRSDDSDVLVTSTDEGWHRWRPFDAPLAENEVKETLTSCLHYPLIRYEGEWMNPVEIRLGSEIGVGWVLYEKLKLVETYPLTQEELAEKEEAYMWTYDGETYFITWDGDGDGEVMPMVFFVGKLTDGCLVSPYMSTVDSIPSFKSGNKPLDMKKFTSEDKEYVLQHAKSFERGMCLVRYGYYEDDEKDVGIVETRLFRSPEDSSEVCDAPDRIAEYPGIIMGDIVRGVRYPEECKKAGIQGRVMASFIVEKDGSLSDIKVIKGIHPALDREVVRAIRNLKRFSPAKKDGKAVRMRMTIPILFRL